MAYSQKRKESIESPVQIFNKYGDGVCGLMFGFMTAEEAAATPENEEETEDEEDE